MWVPLAVLAVLSIVGGFIGVPAALGGSNHFEHFLEPVIGHVGPVVPAGEAAHSAVASLDSHGAAPAHEAVPAHEAAPAHGAATAHAPAEAHHDVSTERLFTVISVLLGFLGIGIGAAVWLKKPLRAMPKILEEKYYVDEIYEAAVIQPLEHTSRDLLWKIVDVRLIDGFVNGVARGFSGLAGILRYTQTGYARNYAAVILIGAIIIIGYFGFLATR
jgi:NADH-quinone oxidoreductase subunit L